MNKNRASVEKESLIMVNMGSIVPELSLLDKERKNAPLLQYKPTHQIIECLIKYHALNAADLA
jgi:hypothetical protein